MWSKLEITKNILIENLPVVAIILSLNFLSEVGLAAKYKQAGLYSATGQDSQNLPVQVSVFEPNKNKIAQVGIPSYLNQNFRFFEVIRSLVSADGENGTGVHIGKGIVLTNRHVYTAIAGLRAELGAFKGSAQVTNSPAGSELFLIELPSPSAEDTISLKHTPGYMRNQQWSVVDKYNDWAILYDPKIVGQSALSNFRDSKSINKNESLWVLGRPDVRKNGQIAAGSFKINKGNVSIISDIDLVGGFSGSPVVDLEGRIVGLVFGFNPYKREASFANIETIIKDFGAPQINVATVAPAIHHQF